MSNTIIYIDKFQFAQQFLSGSATITSLSRTHRISYTYARDLANEIIKEKYEGKLEKKAQMIAYREELFNYICQTGDEAAIVKSVDLRNEYRRVQNWIDLNT